MARVIAATKILPYLSVRSVNAYSKSYLANAVYHKGYDEREPIEVRVLPDRIQIVSHPGADRSVSIEGLQSYEVFSKENDKEVTHYA